VVKMLNKRITVINNNNKNRTAGRRNKRTIIMIQSMVKKYLSI